MIYVPWRVMLSSQKQGQENVLFVLFGLQLYSKGVQTLDQLLGHASHQLGCLFEIFISFSLSGISEIS